MAVDDLSTNPDYAHFAAIAWCAAHLGIGPATANEKKKGDKGRLTIITPWIRTPKADGEDSLWARTLQTPATVPFMLQFWRAPPHSLSTSSPVRGQDDEEAVVDEVRLLLTLASDVNGVAGVCHGGLVATILDEVAGMLVEVNKRQGSTGTTGATYMTASLAVSYLRPVPSSSSLLAGCRLRRRDGRKLFSDAWIEDGDGRVLARADCLYVKLKSTL